MRTYKIEDIDEFEKWEGHYHRDVQGDFEERWQKLSHRPGRLPTRHALCGERNFIRVLVPTRKQDPVTHEIQADGKYRWVTWAILIWDVKYRDDTVVTYDLASDPSIDFSRVREAQVSALTDLIRARGHIDLDRLKGVPISQGGGSDTICVCPICGKEGILRTRGEKTLEGMEKPDCFYIYECIEDGDYYSQ